MSHPAPEKLLGPPVRFSFFRWALHDQYGQVGHFQDAPGDAAHDEVLHAGVSVSAHDDHVDGFLFRYVNNHLRSVAHSAEGLHVVHLFGGFLCHVLDAQIARLFVLLEDLAQLLDPIDVTGEILVIEHMENDELCSEALGIFHRVLPRGPAVLREVGAEENFLRSHGIPPLLAAVERSLSALLVHLICQKLLNQPIDS